MKHERKLLQLVQVGDIQRVYKHLHRCGKSSLPLVGRSKRVNVNFQLSNGLASLHLAAMSGNVDIMEMLVAQGADVDLADSCGLRPLHYACAEGHTLAVHFLLTKGRSSANMPALDGMTPLHLACAHGHLDIVKLLLQHGADLGLTNVQRYTPLDFAYVYRQPVLISFLQQWLHKHGQTARKLVPNSSTTSPHTRNTAKVSFGQCTSLMPSKNRQFHTVNESPTASMPAIQLRHPTVTTGGNSCSSTSSSSSSLLQQQRPVSSLPLQLDSMISTVDRPPRPPSMSVSTSNTQSPYSLWLSSPSSSGPSQQPRHQFTESRASPSFQQHPSPQLNGNSTLWNLQSPSTSQSFGGDEKSGIGNTSSSSSSSVLHTPKAERFSTPRTPLGEHEESKQNLKDGCFAVQARAVRHFTLGNISFLEGDLITVLRQYDEHWWKGYVTAAGIEKTGLFPADAVQLVDPSRLPLPPVQGEGGTEEEDVQNHRRTPVLPRPVVEETGESEHSDEEDDRPPMSMEEEEDTDGEHSSSGHASSFSAMEASLAPNSSCILLPPSMAPLYRGGVTFPGPGPQGGGSGATSPASPCTGSCGKCAVPLGQQQPSVAQQAHYRHSGASWDSGRGSAYASSADATPPASSVSAMNPLSTFCGTPMTASMMSQSGVVRECSPMEPHRTTPPWPPHPLPRTMGSAGCCDCSCHAPSTTPTYTPWRLPSSEDPTTHLTYFLHNVGLLQHLERIMKAGYDIFTLSRATPEDLTALGITNPQERTKLKAAFQRGPHLVDPLPTSFPENLGTLLWTLGLGDYLDMLQKQGYRDCVSLMELTWEDLEDLGVKKLGHLKKFMLLIERLKRVSIQLEKQLESNLKINYQLPGCFSRPQTVGLLSSHREPSDSPPQNSPSGEFSHNTTTMVAPSAVCEMSSVRIEPEGEPGPGVPTTCPSGCEFSVLSPTSSSSVGMLDVISMLQELENKLDVQGRKHHAHSVRPM